MPVHKYFYGDIDKATRWLGTATHLLSMMGGRFNQRVVSPEYGVKITVSRFGKQEYIKISAEADLDIYEFIAGFYAGNGLYGPLDGERTRHRGNISVAEERGVVVADYSTDALTDTTTGYDIADNQNNPWVATSATVNDDGDTVVTTGQTQVSAGSSFNYHSCNVDDTLNQNEDNSSYSNDSPLPSYDTPVYITNLQDGAETIAPPTMLCIAAAINNGNVIGIDRRGKVFASNTYDDTGDVYTFEPVLPGFITDSETVEAIQWKFNSDGTKAIAAVQKNREYFDQYGAPFDPPAYAPTDGGGVIEMTIDTMKNDDDSISITATVEELPISPAHIYIFAADYYFDPDMGENGEEVHIIADLFYESSVDTSAVDFDGLADFFGYVRMLNLETETIYKTVLTGVSLVRPELEDDVAAVGTGGNSNNGTIFGGNGLIALDLSELAYCTRLGWRASTKKSELSCDRAQDEFGNDLGLAINIPDYAGPVCEDGYAGTDIPGYFIDENFFVALSITAGSRDTEYTVSTGTVPYNVEGHVPYSLLAEGASNPYYVYSSPHTRSLRSVNAWQGNFAVYQEARYEDFIPFSYEEGPGLENIELDIVRFKSGKVTSHRELYDELRAAQIDTGHTPVLPELTPFASAAWLYSSNYGFAVIDPAPMTVGYWFRGGNNLPTEVPA